MTYSDKIDKIYDVVLKIEPMVEAHDKSLYQGDGIRPGLVDRTTIIETMQGECQKKTEAQPANRSNLIALAALFLCAIGLWLQAIK